VLDGRWLLFGLGGFACRVDSSGSQPTPPPPYNTPHPPQKAGKKTYTLLMGKPSPAKLANFPEVEVFVMVAEPQGLILDSKEFLAPIITPHEALLALTGQPFEAGSYRLDYAGLLAWHREHQLGSAAAGDGSRQSGGKNAAAAAVAAAAAAEGADEDDEDDEEEIDEAQAAASSALVAAAGLQLGISGSARGGPGSRAVAVRSAAEYLAKAREFKGLETPATGAEIKAAEMALPGRAGRAAGYEDEPAR